MKLRLSKIFALLVIFFDVSNSMSQPFDIPETSIIKKNQIRKMKIYHTYDLDSNHNPKNNGKLNEVYYFNNKGLIVKEKRQFVTYHYKYDKENKLIFIKEKWKISTGVWIEGYGSQFSYI